MRAPFNRAVVFVGDLKRGCYTGLGMGSGLEGFQCGGPCGSDAGRPSWPHLFKGI